MIRSMKNRQIQFTANMMMLGREVSCPIDLMLGVEHANMRQYDSAELVKHLRNSLQEVHQVARRNLKTSLHQQKHDYDLKVHLKTYEVGDVYKINSASRIGQNKKLTSPWLGPYLVEEVYGSLCKVRSRKKAEWIHHDRLKMCTDANLPLWLC